MTRVRDGWPLCTDCGTVRTRNGGLCGRCRAMARNRPRRLCQRCGLVELGTQQGLQYCAGCSRSGQQSCKRPHMVRDSIASLDREEAQAEVERLNALASMPTLDLMAIAMGRTRERVRQLEAEALERYAAHYRALVTLPEQAGLWVDWDWVLGRRNTERASENDAGPVE